MAMGRRIQCTDQMPLAAGPRSNILSECNQGQGSRYKVARGRVADIRQPEKEYQGQGSPGVGCRDNLSRGWVSCGKGSRYKVGRGRESETS